MNKAKTEALASVRAHWLRGQGSNLQPTPYAYPNVSTRGGLYHLPYTGARRFLRAKRGVLPYGIVSEPSQIFW